MYVLTQSTGNYCSYQGLKFFMITCTCTKYYILEYHVCRNSMQIKTRQKCCARTLELFPLCHRLAWNPVPGTWYLILIPTLLVLRYWGTKVQYLLFIKSSYGISYVCSLYSLTVPGTGTGTVQKKEHLDYEIFYCTYGTLVTKYGRKNVYVKDWYLRISYDFNTLS